MKNIAIVTHDMFGGGCERVIAQLANWFVTQKIKVTIVTEYKAPCFYDLCQEVQIISLSDKDRFSSKDILTSYYKLRKKMIALQPDVILAMPEKVNVWVVLAMMGTGIPVVVSERNNPAIYPRSKIKRILRTLFYPIGASGYIFQTREASEFFSKSIRRKSIVLPNPLDLQRLPNNSAREKRKEIVGVGRLEKQKNFHLLIDAFSDFLSTHRDFILTIYGEGSMRVELEAYAKAVLPIGSYSFPGKKKDLLSRLSKASMFVLSSDYEGMPNVLIEAMALGLPVVATDCPSGGPRELIQDGENGMLFPVNDRQALTKSMCVLVENENYAESLGRNAIKIRKRLDIDKIGMLWLDYLKDVYRQKRKS